MGLRIEYNCSNCGFEFINDHLNFYYDEKTKRVKQFMILKLTYDLGKDSKIGGNIKKTYCLHCNKIIEIYEIRYYPEDMSKEQAIDIVNKGLRKDKSNLVVKIGNPDEDYWNYDILSDGELINCPNCNNEIKDKVIFENCPKCGESIHYGKILFD